MTEVSTNQVLTRANEAVFVRQCPGFPQP